MSKKQKDVEANLPPVADKPVEAVQVTQHKTVSELFSRSINNAGKMRSLALKRVLTRPLVSMSNRGKLAVQASSDMYLMDLPLKGRAGGIGATRVIDALELVQTENGFVEGDEIIVVCHELMCSALQRSGFGVFTTVKDDKGNTTYTAVAGKPISGAMFAFLSGNIEDGKRYRSISVAELQ